MLLLHAQYAYGLEEPQGAQPVGVRRVLGRIEGHLDVALGRQVEYLVRLGLLDQADQVGAVGEVPVVELEVEPALVDILVQVVDPLGVEARAASLHPVDHVALLQEKFHEVGAVLARDARDQRCLHAPLQ